MHFGTFLGVLIVLGIGCIIAAVIFGRKYTVDQNKTHKYICVACCVAACVLLVTAVQFMWTARAVLFA